MHKRQKTIDVVKALHGYQDQIIDDAELIKSVCDYYDFIKDEKLSQDDLKFLKKISNTVGIPHYFDHLQLFQQEDVSLHSCSLSSFSDEVYESTLYTDNYSKVHRYQKNILNLFTPFQQNRYFLSASTVRLHIKWHRYSAALRESMLTFC